jgi:hypothetical protein
LQVNMIRYALQCSKGHAFDAWFGDSAAFDVQVKGKLVTCPQCGTHKVEKQLMAPRLNLNAGTYREAEQAARIDAQEAVAEQAQPGTRRGRKRGAKKDAVPAPTQGVPTTTGIEPRLLEALREIRREVTEKSEYVGRRFAEEARKIHLDEAPARGIYGEASLAEVEALVDEGIPCAPLPVLPEDFN